MCTSNYVTVFCNKYEQDPVTKTMQDFSGYPIQDSHLPNSFSLLSVDSESLQKQVISRFLRFFYLFCSSVLYMLFKWNFLMYLEFLFF